MQLMPVNVFGTLERDRAHKLDRFSRFLPVGFYYKAFLDRKWAFPHWERAIRKLSGLGTPNFEAPRVRTRNRHVFCDVLVIGAGPLRHGGALAAGRAGANVMLVDENARIGGSLTYAHGCRCRVARRLQRLTLEIEQCAADPRDAGDLRLGVLRRSLDRADRLEQDDEGARAQRDRCHRRDGAAGRIQSQRPARRDARFGRATSDLSLCVRPMDTAVVLTANTEGYAAHWT
jgi:sarcosine oxidase subunit alpha